MWEHRGGGSASINDTIISTGDQKAVKLGHGDDLCTGITGEIALGESIVKLTGT